MTEKLQNDLAAQLEKFSQDLDNERQEHEQTVATQKQEIEKLQDAVEALKRELAQAKGS